MLSFESADLSLFFSALISSTLFPGGSEALLLYRLNEGGAVLLLIIIATTGNLLGSLITYAMGKAGISLNHKLNHRWFHISDAKIEKAEHFFNRFGKLSLLLAWLPVIGDPLCLVAGMLRFNILWFIVLVGTGKLARYTVLTLPFL